MLNTTTTIDSLLPTIRRAVISVLKSEHHPDVGDLVNDTVIRLLDAPERLSEARSAKGLAYTVAKNIAKDHCKRACNSNPHDRIAMMDLPRSDEGEATSGEVELVGPDGRATVERRASLAALRAAMATLEGDDRTFVQALIDGADQKDAGALVGWSPATATRRKRQIFARLRAQVAA